MVAEGKKGGRQIVWTVLRGVVGFGIAILLIRMVLKQQSVDLGAELRVADSGLLVLAFGLYALTSLIGVVRWKCLLDAQEVRLSWWELLRLTMIGIFFSLALPGAVSGDFLKMVYIRRHAGKRTTEAVLTIMLDRIFGLLGLLLVALLSLVLCWDFVQGAPTMVRSGALVVGFGSGVGLAGVLAVQFREGLMAVPGVRPLLDSLAKIGPAKVVAVVVRMVGALDIYRNRKRVALAALLLSVLVHVIFSLAVFSVTRAVGERQMPLKLVVLSSQVANTVAAIPLTPAGLGLRDNVLVRFFEAGGAADAKAGVIPVLMSVIIACWAGVGLLFFIFAKGEPVAAVVHGEAGAASSEKVG